MPRGPCSGSPPAWIDAWPLPPAWVCATAAGAGVQMCGWSVASQLVQRATQLAQQDSLGHEYRVVLAWCKSTGTSKGRRTGRSMGMREGMRKGYEQGCRPGTEVSMSSSSDESLLPSSFLCCGVMLGMALNDGCWRYPHCISQFTRDILISPTAV